MSLFPLIPDKLYRIAYTANDPKIRGKAVSHVKSEGLTPTGYGEKVREVLSDGSLGDYWLVRPGLIIPLHPWKH